MNTHAESLRHGMSTAARAEPRIREIEVSEDTITAHLVDGRVISVPLAWSWRLSEATSAQRRRFRIIGDGQGVHWPDIDEDISAEGMLHGIPASRPKTSTSTGRLTSSATKMPQPTSRQQRRGTKGHRPGAVRG